MTELARRKTTKKPVRRRPAAKSGGSFGKLGWTAAAVLAIGWVVSDGRAVGYLGGALPPSISQMAGLRPAAGREGGARAASLRPSAELRSSSVTRASDTRAERRSETPPVSSALRPPVPPAAVPTHVASIAPSPAPRLSPMRRPQDEPATAARRADRPVPPAPTAAYPAATAQIEPAAPRSGGLHHATRLLVMRDSPDENGRHVGSVVSGMQVEVLKAAGHWRYVKADAGEGWVDGSFLAGESSAGLAPSAPEALAYAMPAAPPVQFTGSIPVPPMGIRAR